MSVKQSQEEDLRNLLEDAESLSRDLEFLNSAESEKHKALQKAKAELASVVPVNRLKDQICVKS